MHTLVILLLSVTCVFSQDILWSCDFEADFCGFVSGTYLHTTATSQRDDFLRDSGTTPSGSTGATGPPGAQDGDWYMHYEASFRSSNERAGVVTSPLINVGNDLQNIRVNFYYYDHGNSLDTLTLRTLNSDGSQSSYLVSDAATPTQAWNFTSIVLTNPGSNFQIQFEASTEGSFAADWAIDTITVTAERAGCANNPCHSLASCSGSAIAPFYQCTCNQGYTGDGTLTGTGCGDINECNLGVCTGENSQCNNFIGSYSCEQCRSGYEYDFGAGNTYTCRDINECNLGVCIGANSQCNNFIGSYSCEQCRSGYEYDFGAGNAYTCKDINECNLGVCIGANSQCNNFIGSYSCEQCRSGYEYDFGAGNTYACRDINECSDVNYCTGTNTLCTNLQGSPASCTCQPGYTIASVDNTGGNFRLVCTRNECLNNPCPSNSECQDLTDGYRCVCSAGYEKVEGTGDQDNLVCRDIDECRTINCDADADCINLQGTFECRCRLGFRQIGSQLTTQCFLNGGLSQWANFQGCSALCGGGEQVQTRSCSSPAPEVNGDPCDPEAALQRTVLCNTNSCTDCEIPKPCHCQKAVQYTTGNEPDSSLVAFNGIQPADTEVALVYLNIWNRENFHEFCLEAHCNIAEFQGGINNVTTYINTMTSIDEANEQALEHMREVIDCNENDEIEANLWRTYDLLCDRGVAIRNIKLDLMNKRKMFEEEKERCEKRSWFGSMVEKFYKKF